MKRSVAFLCLAILLWQAQPARAWDPDEREYPLIEPPEPTAEDRWIPEPARIEPPEGIYLVTDVYAGDTVVRSGPVTTYTTETVHEITGSYARVLDSVRTGDPSTFDGAAFNGRASLTDGRPVAGTYYEDFVRTDYGFVPVSVVFFQDDSELARTSVPSPAASPTSPEASRSVAAPEPSVAPAERIDAPVVGYVTPSTEREDRDASPGAPAIPSASSVLPDRSIDVLRGRRISISFSGPDVRAWRAVSTEGVALGALDGAAAQPFVIRWDRLAPPNASWLSRFVLDYADGTSHELIVRVTVRAPGLVE